MRDIVRVANTRSKKQPGRLNGFTVSGADLMVLISDAASWQAYWGEGEAPPAVDFSKETALVVSSWMASGRPGSLKIQIAGYSDDKKAKTRTVLVQDSVSGSWDTPGGASQSVWHRCDPCQRQQDRPQVATQCKHGKQANAGRAGILQRW